MIWPINRRGREKSFVLLAVFMIVPTFCAVGQEGDMIPLTVERNRSLVTVQIDDVVIPRIILDTGFASDGLMIYNPTYLDSVDLTRALEVRVGGAGSGEPATALMVDSAAFRLGDVTMTNQRLLFLQSDTYKGFPSNGIIGYSIFGHYVTALDYDANTMTLYDSDAPELDSGWTALPLYFKDNNIPWVDASVAVEDEAPRALSMYIDYAAGDAIVLLEKPEMKFGHPKDTVNLYLGRGLSGDIYGRTGTISKLMVGPYVLNSVKASFAPAGVRSKQDGADAILGHASLSRFNLIFDYAGRRLYLRPNTHVNDPFD